MDNPWRFAGEHLDRTGLYKIGERYYDAHLGRWTQQDPVDDVAGVHENNRYPYARNTPVNLTDPSGLHTSEPRVCGHRDFYRGHHLYTFRWHASFQIPGQGRGHVHAWRHRVPHFWDHNFKRFCPYHPV